MIHVIIISLIIFLVLFTGVASDDYHFIVKDYDSIEDYLYPVNRMLTTPILHYTHLIYYNIIGVQFLWYDVLKILYIILSIYMIEKFFAIYMNRYKALLLSFLFVFFPTHDATTFWFIGQYLLLTISLYFFSFYLAFNNKLYLSFLFAILASFISYGSTPIALGLGLLFILNKEVKKSFIILIPNVIYIFYFIFITKYLDIGTQRLNDSNIITIVKQYILQVGTFLDSIIGPSFWLKIVYSFTQISLASIVIGIILTVFFIKYYVPRKEKLNINLFLAFLLIVLSSFGIFSLTGYYPQLAFNLGNRVTIFGSLLASLLIVFFLMNGKKSAVIVFSVFIFSILGISDHWKIWNKQQMEIIDNISKNKDLKEVNIDNLLFVSYNQYSQFGYLSHIEFFAEGISTTIFQLATKRDLTVLPLNKRFYFDNISSNIVDKKYKKKYFVDEMINVYDSKKDTFLTIKKYEINTYIKSLPDDKRHWVQLLDKDSFILKVILKLMPRLEYAL